MESVVLRLHVVPLSVMLVNQDHIGWKSWKLTARTINPTPSLFVAQSARKAIQLLPGEHMGHFWETGGGVRKSGVL